MKKKADAEVLRCIGLAFITLFHLHFANRCILSNEKGDSNAILSEKGRFAHSSFAVLFQFI